MRQTNTMRNWAPMRPSKKPRPRCVAPEIMGYHHVDRAWIAHKLGLPAMRLWIYLMSNRDYRGRSFAFLVNAAAKIGMSKRTSIRAMARLMRARLVIPEGHQPHPTPRHKLVRAHIVRGGQTRASGPGCDCRETPAISSRRWAAVEPVRGLVDISRTA